MKFNCSVASFEANRYRGSRNKDVMREHYNRKHAAKRRRLMDEQCNEEVEGSGGAELDLQGLKDAPPSGATAIGKNGGDSNEHEGQDGCVSLSSSEDVNDHLHWGDSDDDDTQAEDSRKIEYLEMKQKPETDIYTKLCW